MTPSVRFLLAALASSTLGLFAQPSEAPEEKAHALNEAGVKHYEAREFAAALGKFEEARRLDPKNEVIGRNLARALHGHSVNLEKADNLDEALRLLRRAIELDGAEPAFPVKLAQVLQKKGDVAEARRVLTRALEQHPGAADVHESFGRFEYDEENLKDALLFLEGATKLDPTRSERLAAFLKKVRREAEVEQGTFRDQRGLFTVKFDDEEFRRVSQAVLDLLDRHYNRLANDLDHWPQKRVTVVLYTRGDFDLATGAREWAGGLFDGKIRLPVRNFDRAAREIDTTLAHELTHLFVRSLTRRCPLWLNEGLAQIQEGRTLSQVAAKDLLAAHESATLKAFSSLPSSWVSLSDRALVSRYYAQSLAFTQFLRHRYGWSSLTRILRGLDKTPSFDQLCREVFGTSLEELEALWRAQL